MPGSPDRLPLRRLLVAALTVAPALARAQAPTILVQVPQPAGWRIGLPVGVAVLSAAIAGFSAFLAWRSQQFGFRKDAAAVAREIGARRTQAALRAFENNVARPVGMLLDQVEQVVGEVVRIVPVSPDRLDAERELWATRLAAESANAIRLCDEADGALTVAPDAARAGVFRNALLRAAIDDRLLAATIEALRGPHGEAGGAARAAFGALMTDVAAFKIGIRRLLEAERTAEERRWAGDPRADPFYRDLRRLLGEEGTRRLLDPPS